GARPSMLDQLVLADLISSRAYDRHVRRSRLEYRTPRDTLVTALPDSLVPQGISAGLQLVLPLSPAAEAEVPAAARRHSLAIEPLSPQWLHPRDGSTGLIVGYGAPSKPSFTGALHALLAMLRELPR